MTPLAAEAMEGAWLGISVAGLFVCVMPWVRRNTWHHLPLIALTIILVLRYMIWRLTDTLPPVEESANFVTGLVFLTIESLALVSTLFTLVVLTRSSDRTTEVGWRLPKLKAEPNPPLVDMFICTYNEERTILERTIVGSLSIDYPNFRVWVLDDGRRDWLRDLCGLHGCNYLTRPDNSHAKAGNINHALKQIAALPEVPEFISILDADFVPARQFLWRTVSLMQDENTGLVQTPQHFVNPDPIQSNLMTTSSWPDEQRFFFDVIMPAKDAWGASFCCGTSSLMRYKALMDIGGFPTDSVTEDYLLTLRLSKKDLRTVFLNERLSMGLAAEGLQEYLVQRGRWCLGFIQIFMGPDGPFNIRNGPALPHRLALLETFLYWFASHAFRMLGLIVPILYLLFDIRAVDVNLADGLSYFLPSYVAQIVVISWLSGKRVLPVMTDVTQLIAAPTVLKACLAGILQPKGHKFKVTAKGGDRSQVLVQWNLLWVFAGLMALTISGVILNFVIDADRSLQTTSSVALFWSWYNIIILFLACMACIEQPRFRTNERLSSTKALELSVNGKRTRRRVMDCSVGGARFAGSSPGPVGSDIVLHINGQDVSAEIVRALPGGFAVKVADTTHAYGAMVNFVYSGDHSANIDIVKPVLVAKHVLSRMIG